MGSIAAGLANASPDDDVRTVALEMAIAAAGATGSVAHSRLRSHFHETLFEIARQAPRVAWIRLLSQRRRERVPA